MFQCTVNYPRYRKGRKFVISFMYDYSIGYSSHIQFVQFHRLVVPPLMISWIAHAVLVSHQSWVCSNSCPSSWLCHQTILIPPFASFFLPFYLFLTFVSFLASHLSRPGVKVLFFTSIKKSRKSFLKDELYNYST